MKKLIKIQLYEKILAKLEYYITELEGTRDSLIEKAVTAYF